jgi:hypothetical protein
MMVFFFIFFIPMTLVFLVLGAGCLVYFFMGMAQLTIGLKEKNSARKEGGLVAIIISLIVLIAAVYFYWKWVWIW